MSEVSTDGAPTERHVRRARWMLALRIVVTLGALAFVASRANIGDVSTALLRVSPVAFLVACVSTALNLGVGSLRWRILLQAYGAPHVPSLATLSRLNYIGFFYNTCLPGGVGGDVVRGIASREAFGETGATSAVAVVLVDRVLGLVGLLLVVALASAAFPLPAADSVHVFGFSMLGLLAGTVAIFGVAMGRTLAPRLPGPLGTFAAKLPTIVRPGLFVVAILLSIATQSGVAWTGHVIVQSLAPHITLTNSLVVIPVAMATTFLPFLIGGTGAREAVLEQLYGPLGVPAADAYAAGLLIWFSQIVVALFGAFLPMPTLAKPRAIPAEPS